MIKENNIHLSGDMKLIDWNRFKANMSRYGLSGQHTRVIPR